MEESEVFGRILNIKLGTNKVDEAKLSSVAGYRGTAYLFAIGNKPQYKPIEEVA